MRRRVGRSLRTRLLLGALGGLTVALVALTLAFNIVLRQSLLDDTTGLAQERAEARAAVLVVEGGALTPAERRRLDQDETEPSWTVATDGQRIQESGVPTALASAVRQAVRTRDGVSSGPLRLASAPVVVDGTLRATVVSAVSLDRYERTATTALLGSIALSAVILAAVAFATWWALRAALRPVATMTADAANWSEMELDRRFRMGTPRDELTGLAATLDGLLDRIASSLRHERHVTSEISHELRTPLARIIAHAELGSAEATHPESREAFEGVLRSAHELSRTLDALLAAGRAAGDSSDACDLAVVVQQAVDHLAQESAARGIVVQVSAVHARAAVSSDVVDRALAPILTNALRYAERAIAVDVRDGTDHVEVHVTDDGPGIVPAESEWIFQPGRRGSAGAASPDGAGLGLSLARRLARAAGGDVVAVASETGGSLVLSLPAAPARRPSLPEAPSTTIAT